MIRSVVLFCLLFSTAFANEVFDKRHILYLMSIKDFNGGIEEYLKYYEKNKKHDFELLKEIGNIILNFGSNSEDMNDQLITLYGISLSGKEAPEHFFESAIRSQYPVVEAAAINILGRMHENYVDDLIQLGLKSDYLQVRLEALHLLIARKAKNALGQVESLSNLLPSQFLPYFVEFYAVYASNESIRKLKTMMTNPDANVRIVAILSAAIHAREDLLPNIRAAITHSDPALKEAAATALGLLKDLSGMNELKIAALSPFPETKLAALFSLHKLGDHEAKEKIFKLAEEGNLFAIHMCGEIPGSVPTLQKLIANPDKNVKLNAALSLLKNRNSLALSVIEVKIGKC